MNDEKFRELSHTADAGIEAFGTTIEETFENTALGMLQLAGVGGAGGDSEKEVSFSAPDTESLLVDFLNEILFMLNSEEWIPGKFKCSLSGNELRVRIKGADASSVDTLTEIKAATYHNLEIKNEGDRWKARVFFDL